MDIASLMQKIERLISEDPSIYAEAILDSGFKCMRCGWCCRENFNIRITSTISRPSNAISIFPDDIRRIIKGTGLKWDEIAQPDVYSCLSDGEKIIAIGWILRRNEKAECIFYRKGRCTIYEWRPMICRCYPFFMGENGVEVMNCTGLGNKITMECAEEIAEMLKRYEMKKLRSYIGILKEIGDLLDFTNLHQLPLNYSCEVLVCDGERISKLGNAYIHSLHL